ncbi:hypothetical protein PM082_022904 [Marasmius tenuissimus]|nr:hypothetical protein PM082_022904 [Marasmius tenuissimus]
MVTVCHISSLLRSTTFIFLHLQCQDKFFAHQLLTIRPTPYQGAVLDQHFRSDFWINFASSSGPDIEMNFQILRLSAYKNKASKRIENLIQCVLFLKRNGDSGGMDHIEVFMSDLVEILVRYCQLPHVSRRAFKITSIVQTHTLKRHKLREFENRHRAAPRSNQSLTCQYMRAASDIRCPSHCLDAVPWDTTLLASMFRRFRWRVPGKNDKKTSDRGPYTLVLTP